MKNILNNVILRWWFIVTLLILAYIDKFILNADIPAMVQNAVAVALLLLAVAVYSNEKARRNLKS